MLRTIIATLLGALALWPLTALPCGGGFGDGLHIDPSQKIVIAFDKGTETYIFSPHFCGQAAQFGMILPIPGKLTQNPELASKDLVPQLETLTAPKIVYKTACSKPRAGGGGFDAGAYFPDAGSGVTVINKGQVGIFDWVLIKADTAAAFTDWLDTNKFPHDTSAGSLFNHYVTQGWYFVAFKVTADSKAPPAGQQICGDLGPLSLSFEATAPVLPARIAAVEPGYSFAWRVYTIADTQLRMTTSAGSVGSTLRFSGALSAADLSSHSEIAKLAAAGKRVTKLDLQFYGGSLKDDIRFEANPNQKDFRQVITRYTYVPCDGGVVVNDAGAPMLDDAGQPLKKDDDGGCSLAGNSGLGSSTPISLALALLALVLLRRRRRQR